MSFNPRPGLATGATTASNLVGNVTLFQSAPRPCDRGDVFLLHRGEHIGRFNPRPGLATGATP